MGVELCMYREPYLTGHRCSYYGVGCPKYRSTDSCGQFERMDGDKQTRISDLGEAAYFTPGTADTSFVLTCVWRKQTVSGYVCISGDHIKNCVPRPGSCRLISSLPPVVE